MATKGFKGWCISIVAISIFDDDLTLQGYDRRPRNWLRADAWLLLSQRQYVVPPHLVAGVEDTMEKEYFPDGQMGEVPSWAQLFGWWQLCLYLQLEHDLHHQ
jgi:hypothetical protein